MQAPSMLKFRTLIALAMVGILLLAAAAAHEIHPPGCDPELADDGASEEIGELEYNGIVLPEAWPPRHLDPESTEPMPVPYLLDPPAVIPIDVGRQLFPVKGSGTFSCSAISFRSLDFHTKTHRADRVLHR